jgi:hypothetical protein
MPGRGENKLEPRVQEVLNAIAAYNSAVGRADQYRKHEHLHHLLIRLTTEEFNQVRFITAQVGSRDC